MNPIQPKWYQVARKYLGVAEIVGPKHSSVIQKWLTDLKAWWKDDETPWCGVALAAWMQEAGLTYPKAYYRAKAWADWGAPCDPCFGAIAVYGRQGGGHVGIIVGINKAGNYMILGGNQSNKVSIVPISNSRLIAIRWPAEDEPVSMGTLPVYESFAALSTNEA
jgi:uncharacterized protein (TIGR02594 family)